MKVTKLSPLLLGLLMTHWQFAQSVPHADAAPDSFITSSASETSATRRIAAAKKQIEENPRNVQAYNELAAALIIRSRESADPTYYQDAATALAQGVRLESNNFQLRKTRVALLLAQQKYEEARQQASLLNREVPDDAAIYGYLAEAEIALGDYEDADKSAQWMLNMQPNNVPGLLIGADLRVLYGDADGALELLDQAEVEVPPTEREELAWIENKAAAIELETGNLALAERSLAHAQRLFPGYRETLVNLARLRLDQHRAGAAQDLFKQAAQIHSDPCVLYEAGVAQQAAGSSTAARREAPETPAATPLAATPWGGYDDTQHCAVLMEAANTATATEALQLAERLIAVRHDVWTLDAYAWALYENGQYARAEAAIQRAIQVGIRSAQIFDHAGHIAQKMEHSAEAAKYFELSLRTNPDSPYAEDARLQVRPAAASAQTEPAALRAPQPSTRMNDESDVTIHAALTPADSSSKAEPARDQSTPEFSPVPDEWLTPRPTDSERMVRAAQAQVRAHPKSASALASLGTAYSQRARETADIGDFELAEQSLKTSLQIEPSGFAAAAPLGTLAAVCMGEHRFEDALNFAQQALALGSGDVSPFAIVGDAYADMGEYEQAAASYARLNPATAPSPHAAYARDSRISWLRLIAGDTPAAIQLMKSAVAEAAEAQIPRENLAWLHFELGEYYTLAGDTAAADASYRAALSIHPGDYRALASLARLRANNGRYTDAILLYRKAIAVVPMPVFAAELGDVYAKIGNQAEAEKEYRLVEYIARLGQINQVLHNRDLAMFYADHDIKLPEALNLARREFEVRHDVYTWDALAWALYKNGEYDEAYRASQTALQFGTRDALLLYHNGAIAAKIGRSEQAEQNLSAALAINPHFHLIYADAARKSLSSLNVAQIAQPGMESHEHQN